MWFMKKQNNKKKNWMWTKTNELSAEKYEKLENLPIHNTLILLDCVSTLIIQQKKKYRFNSSNNDNIIIIIIIII